MPPSPRITVTINEARFRDLCTSLTLNTIPSIRFVRKPGSSGPARVQGLYAAGQVTIFYGFPEEELERLRFIASEITATLLHEVRHHWQSEVWGAARFDDKHIDYCDRPTEKDAETYAKSQQHNWVGLVRVNRTQHGSGFSQLSRARSRLIV